MNGAATVARALIVAAVLPATAAAGYAHALDQSRPGGSATSGASGPAASGPAASRPAGNPAVSLARRAITPKPAPFLLGTVAISLSAFDHAVKHKASLRMMFLRWNTPIFPVGMITKNAANGAETVIELQPLHYTMQQIADGVGDAWLTGVFAPGIAAFGKAVTISFAPEMNGQWYSYGFGRTKPADYIRAWRHVHTVLAGTTAGPLVTWLWQPSAIHFSTPSPKPWWPGAKYVNEVGLDGYYVVPGDTFKVIFGATIRLVRSLTRKPILIGETAVGVTTTHQVADIKDLFAGIRRNHLRGIVWFNIPQHAGKYHQDWRLQDHPRELRAFIAQLAKI
jgi:hypothetical protein